MNFHDAQETFRRTAGGDYEQPDRVRSIRKADGWRLRDYQGRLLAIVSESGEVIRPGSADDDTGGNLTMWPRKSTDIR